MTDKEKLYKQILAYATIALEKDQIFKDMVEKYAQIELRDKILSIEKEAKK